MGLAAAVGVLVTACASVPKSESKRAELEAVATATLRVLEAKDPSVRSLIDQSAGYVVFPAIKQGGAIIGGAGGTGVVYENGQRTGFAELSQASVGAQLGGQKYAELVIVRDKFTLDKMKAGSFDFGGQASAVILKQGAGTATQWGPNGVAVIVQPTKGAMVNASVSGQQIKFKG
jgi:lipid-binding SYLF domain-containing protein